jgi:tetratricopeptide (TPR) repeat protein
MRPIESKPALLFAAAFAGIAAATDVPLRLGARVFPPMSSIPSTELTAQDVAFASTGFRAAGADMAWVQMLQYTAGGLDSVPEVDSRGYSRLKDLALRVVRLDPSFHRAYTYAAGILAWFHGVDRPDDAAAILQEGLRNDPGQKMYPMYIAAIAFQKKGDAAGMVALLDSAYDDPQTSPPMRAILANLHKSRGEYEKALAIWEDILSSDRDQTEHGRARVAIPELKRLIQERAAAPKKRP